MMFIKNQAKIFSLILSIALLLSIFSGIAVSADSTEKVELIKNGSFEEVNEKGKPVSWSYGGGAEFADAYSITNSEKHSGSSSLKISIDPGKTTPSIYTSQKITNIVGGTEYEVSGWYKLINKLGRGLSVKITFYNVDADGNSTTLDGTVEKSFKVESNKWEKSSFNFTAPAQATTATLIFRFADGGEVYMDDLSVIGKSSAPTAPAEPAKPAETENPKPPVASTDSTDKVELIKDGGFEVVDAAGKPVYWSYGGGAEFASGYSITSSEKHGGSNALKISFDPGKTTPSIYTAQTINNLVGGTEYEVSGWYKLINKLGRGLAVKVTFYNVDADGNSTTLDGTFEEKLQVESNKWEKSSFNFTAPEKATRATLIFRFADGGEVYMDDLSVRGQSSAPKAPTEPTKADNLKPPVEGNGNLIENGDFEVLDSVTNGPEQWKATGNWAQDAPVSVTTEAPFSGKNAIKIKTNEAKKNPFTSFLVKDVQPNTEYQISVWLKRILTNDTSAVTGASIKYEFYSENEVNVAYGLPGSGNSPYFKTPEGQWQQVAHQFITPEGCKAISIYLRLYGAGEIYWDDAECYMTAEPLKTTLETDNIFYYTDWDTGTAELTLNNAVYEKPEGAVIDFALKDGENIIEERKGVLAEDKTSFTFNVSSLAKKASPYTIEAVYKDAAGTILETTKETIYRYDRPTCLTEDGVYMKDGKPFMPIMGYHADSKDFAYCAEAGINLVQSWRVNDVKANSSNIPTLLEYLDEAEKHGIMVFINLYSSTAAGSSLQREKTIATVKAVKDHPATFGYMVMDEPFSKTDPNMYEDLKNAYIIIRNIDPDHPVFINEATTKEQNLKRSGQCCDILGHDPYPGGNRYPMPTHIADRIQLVKEATNYKKPVYAILQAYDYLGYEPTSNDMRHMAYQALLAGAEGIGYFDVTKSDTDKSIYERDLYEGIVSFYETEFEDACKAFILGEYPVFAEQKTEEVWSRSWVKGQDIYTVILNRQTKDNVANIPLTSLDGTISVGGYKAVAADISGAPAIEGNGTLTVNLAPDQVILYKVTPNETVDFSSLTTSMFRDLNNHPWAKAQIEKLAEKGVVNSQGVRIYAPETKITRADFAMFLIRTLGLTGSSTENFADVNPDSYYAKELAIGKEIGILKGVGNNEYNPHEEISRQDMMVICARGMRYASKLGTGGTIDNLADFTDKANIADYAIEDIAAMVREGIVLGNADKTINPLGNTTRAEAAVIMYRILNK